MRGTPAELPSKSFVLKLIPFVEIVSAGPRIIPYLERELAHAEGMKSIRLAQALCMLGSASGVPVLIREFMDALSGSELPRRTADIKYVQLPPNRGAMPDTAYYPYSLAQASWRSAGRSQDAAARQVSRFLSNMQTTSVRSSRSKPGWSFSG